MVDVVSVLGVIMNSCTKKFSKEDILSVMPQQPPFLFVDEAEYVDGEIIGKYKIKDPEVFADGHFKGNPVFPGTLMFESLGQLCVLGLVKGVFEGMECPADPSKIFFTSSEASRCMRICRPNEVLELRAKPTRIRRPIANFEASIKCNGERTAFIEKLTLTFDYIAK